MNPFITTDANLVLALRYKADRAFDAGDAYAAVMYRESASLILERAGKPPLRGRSTSSDSDTTDTSNDTNNERERP